jgi:hypothetical protein
MHVFVRQGGSYFRTLPIPTSGFEDNLYVPFYAAYMEQLRSPSYCLRPVLASRRSQQHGEGTIGSQLTVSTKQIVLQFCLLRVDLTN